MSNPTTTTTLEAAFLSDLEELNAYCTDDEDDRKTLAGELAARFEDMLVRPQVDGLFKTLNGPNSPCVVLTGCDNTHTVAYTNVAESLYLAQECTLVPGRPATWSTQLVELTKKELMKMINEQYPDHHCAIQPK